MKTSIVTLLITFCFYLSVYAQAPQDKATELKEQALSSLKILNGSCYLYRDV